MDIKKIIERSSLSYGLSPEDAIEILDTTFTRFWQYPNFDAQKARTTDIEKSIVLYLAKIAQRTLIDVFKKKSGGKISPYNGEEQIIYDFPKISDPKLINDKNFQILKEVLSLFSDKHKAIYLTYATYEQNGYKLPRKLLAELRETFNISQNTIRSYRHEVIERIKEHKELWMKLLST